MNSKLTWFSHATLGFEIDDYQIVGGTVLLGNPANKTTADKVKADFS